MEANKCRVAVCEGCSAESGVELNFESSPLVLILSSPYRDLGAHEEIFPENFSCAVRLTQEGWQGNGDSMVDTCPECNQAENQLLIEWDESADFDEGVAVAEQFVAQLLGLV